MSRTVKQAYRKSKRFDKHVEIMGAVLIVIKIECIKI